MLAEIFLIRMEAILRASKEIGTCGQLSVRSPSRWRTKKRSRGSLMISAAKRRTGIRPSPELRVTGVKATSLSTRGDCPDLCPRYPGVKCSMRAAQPFRVRSPALRARLRTPLSRDQRKSPAKRKAGPAFGYAGDGLPSRCIRRYRLLHVAQGKSSMPAQSKEMAPLQTGPVSP
jgi:hypothetical protein